MSLATWIFIALGAALAGYVIGWFRGWHSGYRTGRGGWERGYELLPCVICGEPTTARVYGHPCHVAKHGDVADLIEWRFGR